MTDYSEIQERAGSAIKKRGKSATLRKTTAASHDPITGADTGATSTNHTISIVEKPFKLSEIDGTVIKRTDKRVMMSAYQATEPSQNDSVVIGGIVFNVEYVKVISPGDTVLYYELQLRQ